MTHPSDPKLEDFTLKYGNHRWPNHQKMYTQGLHFDWEISRLPEYPKNLDPTLP